MLSDADHLAQPLHIGSDPASMAAHLRHVTRLLRGGDAAAAVMHLTSLYDRSVMPRENLACKMGCAFCCAQTVIVTAAEAFAVAARVRSQPARVEILLTAAPQRLGGPKSAWRDCLLLDEDKTCSVYDVRPLACHGFVSVDLSACIAFFTGDGDTTGFVPNDRQQVLYVCRMMLCAAHLLAGHGEQPGYELGSAVAAILRQPDAEARWHKGENILKDVPQGPPIPPAFAQEIRRMADFVAPTL